MAPTFSLAFPRLVPGHPNLRQATQIVRIVRIGLGQRRGTREEPLGFEHWKHAAPLLPNHRERMINTHTAHPDRRYVTGAAWRRPRNMRLCRAALAALLLAGTLALMPSRATAGCWLDQDVAGAVRGMAEAGFPRVTQEWGSVQVQVCEDSDFSPGRGGDHAYFPFVKLHRIRVRLTVLGEPALDSILAHELGHAEAHLRLGQQPSHGGHGPDYLAVMIEAGWATEAQRVARDLVRQPGLYDEGLRRAATTSPRRRVAVVLPERAGRDRSIRCTVELSQIETFASPTVSHTELFHVPVCRAGR